MVGVSDISISRGNLNYFPIAEKLRGMSVSSIGALFHAYWPVMFFFNKFIIAASISACDSLGFVEGTIIFSGAITFAITSGNTLVG